MEKWNCGPHWDVMNISGKHKNMFPIANNSKVKQLESIVLTCKSIWYYSQFDEDLFFVWLNRIGCIEDISGIRDELYLCVNPKKVLDTDLSELLGLFYRYKIDMKQLAQFLTPENKEWFYDNKKAFWHNKVFGE